MDFKIIPENLFIHHDLHHIKIKAPSGLFISHGKALLTIDQIYFVYIILACPKPDGHRFSRLWFHGLHIISCLITKQCICLEYWPHLHHVFLHLLQIVLTCCIHLNKCSFPTSAVFFYNIILYHPFSSHNPIFRNMRKAQQSNCCAFLGEGISLMGCSKNYIMYWGVLRCLL